MKIEFTKEKLSTDYQVSKDLINAISEVTFESGQTELDSILNLMTLRLDAYYLAHLSEKIPLQFECKRPTFLDWLLRRRQIAKFELHVKDLLLKPPALPDTQRIYFTYPIE